MTKIPNSLNTLENYGKLLRKYANIDNSFSKIQFGIENGKLRNFIFSILLFKYFYV